MLPDDIRSNVFKYLSHGKIKLVEKTCKSLQRSATEYCRPNPYGGDVIFDGTKLRFTDKVDPGKRPWFSGVGGIMGATEICDREVKILASTDFTPLCGYRMTLGFMRLPDSMLDFKVDVEGVDGSAVEINEDDSRFHELQSTKRIACGFNDFRIPRWCRYPSEYSNQVHCFCANVHMCRPVKLRKRRRSASDGLRCPATTITNAFKFVGEDERYVETTIQPSSREPFYHTEVIRGVPPPEHVTFILSRTDNTLRIHAKMPHHIRPNERTIVHQYTEIIDDVSGPYTWFVEIGPTRNKNGSISVSESTGLAATSRRYQTKQIPFP